MYTGDYTNENIGHEIINMYKTDEKENYIYISPWGTLADERYETVDAVLLARPAGKGRLEIRAKATGLTPQNKSENEKELNFKDEDKINQILKERGLLGLTPIQIKQKLYYDWIVKNNEGIKTISDKFIMSRKIVTQEEMRNIQCSFVLEQLSENISIYIEGQLKNINDTSVKWNFKKVTEKKEEFIKNYNKTITLEDLVNELEEICKRNENDFSKEVKKLSKYAEGEYDETQLNSDFEKTKFRKDWKRVTPMHEPQIKDIKTNGITYGNIPINEILDVNYHRIPPVYLTFKAEKVVRPNTPIYIEYISSKKENNKTDNNDGQTVKTGELSKKEKANAKFMGMYDNGKSITYKFQDIKFRNQSCMTYVSKTNKYENIGNAPIDKLKYKEEEEKKNKGEAFVYAVLQNIIKNSDYWVDENTNNNNEEKLIIKPINTEEDSDYEPFFLDITGNQYDELSYSNMFAYFFKRYPDLFEEFAKNKLSKKDNTLKDFKIRKYFEITREENNIDILIETDNDIFVIENKVKSHINGEKYIDTEDANDNEDSENEDKKDKSIEYTNQLIKYYNYVESKYPDKNRHYFIFKPDYNYTETELKQKIKDISNKDDIEPIIIKKYHHIDYSVIYDFYNNKPQKPQNTADEQALIDYVYFKDFVKALKRHKSEIDNTNELVMEYKFRQAIIDAKKRKQKINPRPNLTGWHDNIKS